MAMKLWHYLVNQFLTQTKKNYKKSVKLSNYHDAVLDGKKAAIALLVVIYNRYHPLHLALVAAYNAWKTEFSAQKIATDILDELLKTTYAMLDTWDTAIRAEVGYNSSAYNLIFDNGRAPFNRSSIEDQIEAYQQLAIKLTPHAGLAAVKTEVENAYAALSAARDAQLVLISSVRAKSNEVETARRAAMEMQWRNVGYSIENFSGDPNFIESLFDIENLRTKPQTVFTSILGVSEKKLVFTRTLLDDDKLLLNNDGNAAIRFYFADTPGGTNANFIEVAANTKRTVEMRDFMPPNYGTYRYLTAENQSSDVATHYIVTIL